MQTIDTESTDTILVRAPQLEPWQPIHTLGCPMCGSIAPTRRALFIALFFHGHKRLYAVSFCTGGRPPVEDIDNPIEAMMKGRSENRPACGGVMEPHLHLTCNCCSHSRLMRTKS